jgi:flagellar motility protein MotE (MotC chaperone)
MENKPWWFNDKCKSLHRNYMKCLNVFNRNKCKENHVNLNNTKEKYKLLEAQLKQKYKRQEGYMMEGLRKSNPNYFYSKYGRSRKLSTKVSV